MWTWYQMTLYLVSMFVECEGRDGLALILIINYGSWEQYNEFDEKLIVVIECKHSLKHQSSSNKVLRPRQRHIKRTI